MIKLINYSLITALLVAKSADSHICNLLFTHSLSLIVCVLQFFGSSFSSGFRISRRKSSEPSAQYPEQFELCGKMFDSWTQSEQVHFVQSLLVRMCHQQHGQINAFLKPMLQRDFISSLPGLFIQTIASVLSLCIFDIA